MLFPTDTKIELACSKDETRFNLTFVHLDVDAQCIVSTDGHRLVKIAVEIEADRDVAGPIPVAAIVAARKQAKKGLKARIVCGAAACTLDDGTSFPRPEGVTFPDWKQVMPKPGAHRIAFNARYLHEIATALRSGKGDEAVTLVITDDLSPILVESGDAARAVGVLMPVRLSAGKGGFGPEKEGKAQQATNRENEILNEEITKLHAKIVELVDENVKLKRASERLSTANEEILALRKQIAAPAEELDACMQRIAGQKDEIAQLLEEVRVTRERALRAETRLNETSANLSAAIARICNVDGGAL